jgi:hypothetical protein
MPKPNLSSMSVDALLKLREDINKTLGRKATELRHQLSMLGGAARQRRGPLKGRKVLVSRSVGGVSADQVMEGYNRARLPEFICCWRL